jgi:hypothetical protein
MRRLGIWLGSALLVACLLGWLLRDVGSYPETSRDHAARIQLGMTFDEVKEILGPPRDELDGRLDEAWPPYVGPFRNPCRRWVTNELVVTVIFDRGTGRVVWVRSEVPQLPPESAGREILSWLKRSLHLSRPRVDNEPLPVWSGRIKTTVRGGLFGGPGPARP